MSVAPLAFAEALAAFEQHLYRRGRSQATVHTYASALGVFATFYREGLQKPGPYVSRLQETDLHAFVDYLRRERRLRAASMNRYVVALHAFFLFVLAQRWTKRDLACDLKTYRLQVPASRERHFACSRGRGRQHYLRALYLKAFRALGHGHLQPIDVPRQLRLRILEQLGQDKALADIRTIDRRERSRILADVRGFLNARAVSAKAKQEVEAWLRGDLAQREGDIAVLSNAAIERFQQANSAELTRHMPEVTVLDVLLDAHRWTGFMDAFVPLSGRQNMAESEKIRQCLAALHAYGCNCGPTQSGRAVGLSKSQVVYMRRHYMGTKQLIDAASMLEQAYSRTPVAQRLDHPGVLLSDAMHVRMLARSLTARSYFRDVSHKSLSGAR